MDINLGVEVCPLRIEAFGVIPLLERIFLSPPSSRVDVRRPRPRSISVLTATETLAMEWPTGRYRRGNVADDSGTAHIAIELAEAIMIEADRRLKPNDESHLGKLSTPAPAADA
jgi:hypothetical protein